MNSQATRLSTVAAALATVAAALVLAAGCAVGPDYRRPEVTAPVAFRGETGPSEAASLADLPWWEVFDDPALQGLVREALAGNYDLRIAVARVEQARALAGVARAELFPWVDYQVGVQRDRGVFKFVPELERPAGGTDTVFLGGLAATWEIDVWGRIRRSNEAARAELFATEEARRGVLLTLVSDVAQAYFELLALDLRLDIARSARDSFDRTYTIFRRRFEQGVVSQACRHPVRRGRWRPRRRASPIWSARSRSRRTRSTCCSGATRGRCRAAPSSPRSECRPPFPPGFRQPCSNAGPTSGRPSSVW